MRWLAIGIVACVIVGGLLWFPGRQERQCLQMLANLDHQINCPGWVAISEEDGTCSNGVWNPKAIVGVTPPEFFRCPVTGTNYVVTFRVGTHPFCPVHGRLIEKYDYRPHQPPRKLVARWVAMSACVLLGVAFAVAMGVVALVKKIRQTRQKAEGGSGDGVPATGGPWVGGDHE